jgi:hypothetical protein
MFARIWLHLALRPVIGFRDLAEQPAPLWGLYAVLARFVPTSLTSILALFLLGRRPFVPSYLAFLDDAAYYRAEIFFLPLFGLLAWLLASALVYLLLRLLGKPSSIDWIMNVIGFSLLAVMPVVWLVDWSAIALGIYGQSVTIPFHAAVSLWEVGLMALGFGMIKGVSWAGAVALGFVVKMGVYIPLAMVFIR